MTLVIPSAARNPQVPDQEGRFPVPRSRFPLSASCIRNSKPREAPDAHVLSHARRYFAHEITDRARGVADPRLLEQRCLGLERIRWCGRNLLGHVAHQRTKVLGARDEVRLAVHLHERPDPGVVMDVAADLTFAGETRGSLRRLGSRLLAQIFGGLLHVAVGLLERLTTVEHAGSGSLPELLELVHRDVRHGLVPPVCGRKTPHPALGADGAWDSTLPAGGGRLLHPTSSQLICTKRK